MRFPVQFSEISDSWGSLEILGYNQTPDRLAKYIELANSSLAEERDRLKRDPWGLEQFRTPARLINMRETEPGRRFAALRRAFAVWVYDFLRDVTKWVADDGESQDELLMTPNRQTFDALRLRGSQVEIVPAFGADFGGLDFLSALSECRDIRRVRMCPICDRIYWARRNDQPACSKRCNNVRHQRRWYRTHALDIKVKAVVTANAKEQVRPSRGLRSRKRNEQSKNLPKNNH
jgi:hypothetical protein